MAPFNADIIELERHLTMDEVAAYYGVTSRCTIWRWRQEGRLPKPDIERGKFLRWKVRSLIEWDNRQAELDPEPSAGKQRWRKLGLA